MSQPAHHTAEFRMVGLGLEDIDKQLRRYLISPLIIYAEDILNHFFLINELIYLAVLGLSCGMWDLSLWYTDSQVVLSCGILVL